MAADQKCSVQELMDNPDSRKSIDLNHYVTEAAGMPTLRDILDELAKPGRDPRSEFEAFSFAEGVEKIEDLKDGMKLPGIVTNVAAFGAFVDIGVHQDGLVHISQLADRFVRDPAEVVKVQQKVEVTVMEVDCARKRISLSMKKDPQGATGGGEQKRDRSERPPRSDSRKGRREKRPAAEHPPKRKARETGGGGGGGGNWFADALSEAEKKKKKKPF